MNLNLTVRPPSSYYLEIAVVIVVGVILSLIYSPVLDKPDKGKKDEKQDGEPTDKYIQGMLERDRRQKDNALLAFNNSKWTGVRNYNPQTKEPERNSAKITNAIFAAGSAATLAIVAFAYFFSNATDFGSMPLRDVGTAFLQGFLIHRGLDGLAPKIFKGLEATKQDD